MVDAPPAQLWWGLEPDHVPPNGVTRYTDSTTIDDISNAYRARELAAVAVESGIQLVKLNHNPYTARWSFDQEVTIFGYTFPPEFEMYFCSEQRSIGATYSAANVVDLAFPLPYRRTVRWITMTVHNRRAHVDVERSFYMYHKDDPMEVLREGNMASKMSELMESAPGGILAQRICQEHNLYEAIDDDDDDAVSNVLHSSPLWTQAKGQQYRDAMYLHDAMGPFYVSEIAAGPYNGENFGPFVPMRPIQLSSRWKRIRTLFRATLLLRQWHARAAVRAYAPNGVGYDAALDHYNRMVQQSQ